MNLKFIHRWGHCSVCTSLPPALGSILGILKNFSRTLDDIEIYRRHLECEQLLRWSNPSSIGLNNNKIFILVLRVPWRRENNQSEFVSICCFDYAMRCDGFVSLVWLGKKEKKEFFSSQDSNQGQLDQTATLHLQTKWNYGQSSRQTRTVFANNYWRNPTS